MQINNQYDLAKLLRVTLEAPKQIITGCNFPVELEVKLSSSVTEREELSAIVQDNSHHPWFCHIDVAAYDNMKEERRDLGSTLFWFSQQEQIFQGKSYRVGTTVSSIPKPGDYILVACVRTGEYQKPWIISPIDSKSITVNPKEDEIYSMDETITCGHYIFTPRDVVSSFRPKTDDKIVVKALKLTKKILKESLSYMISDEDAATIEKGYIISVECLTPEHPLRKESSLEQFKADVIKIRQKRELQYRSHQGAMT